MPRPQARMLGPKSRLGELGEVKSRDLEGDDGGPEPFCPPRHFSSMQKGNPSPTHHTNGEIVVHDVVRNLISILHLLSGDDFQMPAVQHHQGALFDVLQDFCQAAPFITCEFDPRAEGLSCG